MYGLEYLEYLAVVELLAAIRAAKAAIDDDRLAYILTDQARSARKRMSGDTDHLGDDGDLDFYFAGRRNADFL